MAQNKIDILATAQVPPIAAMELVGRVTITALVGRMKTANPITNCSTRA